MAKNFDTENIDKAIASGVKGVFSQGDRVEMHSIDDQLKARAAIRKASRKKFRGGNIKLGCST